MGQRFRGMRYHDQVQPGAADDDERGRLPRPVVRDRRAQGDDVGARASSARSSACARRARPTCCCTTTWARSTARSARGASRAAAPARCRTPSPAAARELRRRDPHRGAGRAHPHEGRPRHRRRARERRRDRTPTSWSRASTRDLTFLSASWTPSDLPAEFVRRRAPLQVPRLVGQGEPRARRAARLHLPARAGRAPARRHLDLAERRLHGARLRRGEVRRSSRAGRTSTSSSRSLTDPSVAPPGKHVMSCFVQYAPYHLTRRATLGRAARGLRRHRRRHHRRVRAEHQEHHPAPPGADAARHRARLRPDRGQHLPGRADARAAVLPAAGAGLGAVPRRRSNALHVRLGDAPRRRHHGRSGQERGRRRS